VFFRDFECTVNFGEVGLVEVHSGLVGRAEVGQAAPLRQEANVIANVDVIRGVRYQDDGASPVGEPPQQRHHFAVQAGVQAGGWFIQEEDAWIR